MAIPLMGFAKRSTPMRACQGGKLDCVSDFQFLDAKLFVRREALQMRPSLG